MWNLIATQKISQVRNWISARLTAEQIEEAERLAQAWLSQAGGMRSVALEQSAGPQPAPNESHDDPPTN
jgi:hypothetical protein